MVSSHTLAFKIFLETGFLLVSKSHWCHSVSQGNEEILFHILALHPFLHTSTMPSTTVHSTQCVNATSMQLVLIWRCYIQIWSADCSQIFLYYNILQYVCPPTAIQISAESRSLSIWHAARYKLGHLWVETPVTQ